MKCNFFTVIFDDFYSYYLFKVSGVTMVSGPPGNFAWMPPWCEFGGAERRRTSSISGCSPQRGPGAGPLAGARGRSPRKILSKFGGLEAISAIQNIQIDMKLKVTKSNNIMNKCHNE